MKFIVVTGMSGAGKRTALKMLEDIGYFCVDNLPVQLVGKLAELTLTQHSEIEKIALGLDVRSRQNSAEIEKALEELRERGYKFEILFLDAQDEVLLKRYKETRRTHPLAGRGRIATGIEEERKYLWNVQKSADYVIDTSQIGRAHV